MDDKVVGRKGRRTRGRERLERDDAHSVIEGVTRPWALGRELPCAQEHRPRMAEYQPGPSDPPHPTQATSSCDLVRITHGSRFVAVTRPREVPAQRLLRQGPALAHDVSLPTLGTGIQVQYVDQMDLSTLRTSLPFPG